MKDFCLKNPKQNFDKIEIDENGEIIVEETYYYREKRKEKYPIKKH